MIRPCQGPAGGIQPGGGGLSQRGSGLEGGGSSPGIKGGDLAQIGGGLAQRGAGSTTMTMTTIHARDSTRPSRLAAALGLQGPSHLYHSTPQETSWPHSVEARGKKEQCTAAKAHTHVPRLRRWLRQVCNAAGAAQHNSIAVSQFH